jgi:hypothetical protein
MKNTEHISLGSLSDFSCKKKTAIIIYALDRYIFDRAIRT